MAANPRPQRNTRNKQQATTTKEEVVKDTTAPVGGDAAGNEVTTNETTTDRVVVETPTTIAEAENNTPAEEENVAEVEKPNVVITTPDASVKTVAKGITISTPATATPEVKEITVEGFIKSKYNLEPEAYTATLARVIRGFNAYNAEMNACRPVNMATAAKNQERWLRVILDALEAPTADSIMCMDTIMFLANLNRETLFNDRLACRAFPLMSDQLRDLFLALQNMIVNAANPRNRQKYIKEQVRLDTITNLLRSENQKTNLQAYFSHNL